MGWANNQMRERQEADRHALSESLLRVANVVVGQQPTEQGRDRSAASTEAIGRIMRYYRLKPVDVPDSVTSIYDQLDYCLRPHGVMYREVKLDKGWHRESFAPLLAFAQQDGTPIALTPGRVAGYWYRDAQTGLPVRVRAGNASRFGEKALCFYRPLPQKRLGLADLLLYLRQCVTLGDVVAKGATALGVTAIGLLLPRLVGILTGPVLASQETRALVGIALCMACTAVSQQLMSSTAELVSSRLEAKAQLGVEASMMMRVLSLPSKFFEDHSPGELKSRLLSVNALCSLLMSLLTSAGVSSLASLLYVTQIFAFAPALVVPALLSILATLGLSVLTSLAGARVSRQRMEAGAAESGLSFAMYSGIRKIRLSGAEQRMFAKWLDAYANVADHTYNPPLVVKVSGVMSMGITLASNVALYYLAVKSGVGQSSYLAFSTAYGMVAGSFLSLANKLAQLSSVRPMLQMAEPLLAQVPETHAKRPVVTDVHGSIRFDHVTFGYDPDMPPVLKDLSLEVRVGEYVAVVGRSGCGKSTLVRLLLGFETPDRGAVYVDERNLAKTDLSSLRRGIGTVMQHDGLFQGSIFYNIALTTPDLTMEGAWEAAEAAGIADDIRAMPMGMHTVISEGQGGVSGGQKQRLMIARAIASKPRLLVFDEATSALDNKAQRQVTDALDAMGCTRIVVAHRLSTIRRCSRILVLDDGCIAEDGTYDELMRKGGLFADLVSRQRADV